MHTTTITLEQLADVLGALPIATTMRHDGGALFTTAGSHPDLGNVVIVQTIEGVALLSEVPAQFVEGHDA